MLRKQLAELNFGPNSDYSSVPEPEEAAYVDWSLPRFNADITHGRRTMTLRMYSRKSGSLHS